MIFKSIYNSVHPEIWVLLLYIISEFTVNANKLHFLILLIALVILYARSGKILENVWLLCVATLPSLIGKNYSLTIIPRFVFGDAQDIILSFQFLLSDFLLVILVYLIVTRSGFRLKTLGVARERSILFTFVVLTIFFVISGISVLFSQFQTLSLYYYLQLIKMITIFFMSYYFFSDPLIKEKTLQVIGIYILFEALLVIMQSINSAPLGIISENPGLLYGVYSPENPDVYRPGGFSGGPSNVGTEFAIFLPIVIGNALVRRNNTLWLFALMLISALLMTGTRTAWLASIFSLFLLYIQGRSIKKNFFIPVWLIKYSAIFWLVLLFRNLPMLILRLSGIAGTLMKQGSLDYRYQQIRHCLTYAGNHIGGIGLGTFATASIFDFPQIDGSIVPAAPHNIFFGLAAETGIMGMTFFLLFIIFVIVSWYTKSKGSPSIDTITSGLPFIIVIIMSSFFPLFFHHRMYFWLWLSAGLALSVPHTHKIR